MVVQIFGIIDLLASISILMLKAGVGEGFTAIIGILIIIKSLLFIKDVVSIIDLIGAIFIFLALMNIFTIITWLFLIWFLQKGLMSLMS